MKSLPALALIGALLISCGGGSTAPNRPTAAPTAAAPAAFADIALSAPAATPTGSA